MLSQFSTNLMVIKANTNIVVSGTEAHPFTTVDVYDMEMSPASTPNKMVQTVNNGMAMIFAQGLESGTAYSCLQEWRRDCFSLSLHF